MTPVAKRTAQSVRNDKSNRSGCDCFIMLNKNMKERHNDVQLTNQVVHRADLHAVAKK